MDSVITWLSFIAVVNWYYMFVTWDRIYYFVVSILHVLYLICLVISDDRRNISTAQGRAKCFERWQYSLNILVYLFSAIVTLFTVYVVTLDALSKYPLFEKIITVKQLIKE